MVNGEHLNPALDAFAFGGKQLSRRLRLRQRRG